METAGERLRGAALVCAAGACWSLGGLFVRLIGDDLDGWTIAFWRSAFMALAVGGWLIAANGLSALAAYRAMGWAGVLSGLLLAASFVMFILAITRTSVANAVVLQSAAPLASAAARPHLPRREAGAADARCDPRRRRWRGADVRRARSAAATSWATCWRSASP